MGRPQRFTRIPTTIEAVEAVELLGSLAGVPAHLVRRLDGGGFQVFNELHQSWINVELGDYIRTDDPRDLYPISRTIFLSTYRPANDGGGE